MFTYPIEDNIARSLMSEFEFGGALIAVGLGDASEHQESFLGLLEVGVVLSHECGGGILSASLVDLYKR